MEFRHAISDRDKLVAKLQSASGTFWWAKCQEKYLQGFFGTLLLGEIYGKRGGSRSYTRMGEIAMKGDHSSWLDEYAVTCRVFKGRWSIRHCLKMYNDINDLKIRMSTRARGKVTRHESMYNPCETCKVLTRHMNTHCQESEACQRSDEKCCTEVWAV